MASGIENNRQAPPMAGSAEAGGHAGRRREHVAVLMLLLATVFWGASFTWAKASAEAANQLLGLDVTAGAGPMLLVGVRFLLASAVWVLVMPRSLLGWTWPSVWRGLYIGGTCGIGMAFQNLGLAHSSEAVTAFLTSLTVLFVPLILSLGGKPPSAAVWIGVAVATAGIWLMTGAQPTGFGAGEWLGLGCAFTFAIYIIGVNQVMKHDDVGRMIFVQLLLTGVVTLGLGLLLPGGAAAMVPNTFVQIVTHPDVLTRLLLLTALPALAGYILLTVYQPRIDPTRASIIYLMEPVFAVAIAYLLAGKGITLTAILGGAMIIAANLTVELLGNRSQTVEPSAAGGHALGSGEVAPNAAGRD